MCALEIISVSLLNNVSAPEHVDKIARADLGEVMGDDDGGLVGAPAFDGFEYQDAGSGVKCRSCFV
jgi:hypothetical protein